MSKNSLEELRSLLEGKKIVAIEEPNAREAICKFVLENGTAFRLHATDLGFWIEYTADKNNIYNSLQSLLTDYAEFIAKEPYRYSYAPTINIINDDYVEITAHNGKVFIGNTKNFSDYEKKVIFNAKGREILSDAAELGDCWKIAFNKNNTKCPEELYYYG